MKRRFYDPKTTPARNPGSLLLVAAAAGCKLKNGGTAVPDRLASAFRAGGISPSPPADVSAPPPSAEVSADPEEASTSGIVTFNTLPPIGTAPAEFLALLKTDSNEKAALEQLRRTAPSLPAADAAAMVFGPGRLSERRHQEGVRFSAAIWVSCSRPPTRPMMRRR